MWSEHTFLGRNNVMQTIETVVLYWISTSTVACTSDTYGSKYNNDNGHSSIDITVVCTSNPYGSKYYNNDNGHPCIA